MPQMFSVSTAASITSAANTTESVITAPAEKMSRSDTFDSSCTRAS
jgi:hypothetical protein